MGPNFVIPPVGNFLGSLRRESDPLHTSKKRMTSSNLLREFHPPEILRNGDERKAYCFDVTDGQIKLKRLLQAQKQQYTYVAFVNNDTYDCFVIFALF